MVAGEAPLVSSRSNLPTKSGAGFAVKQNAFERITECATMVPPLAPFPQSLQFHEMVASAPRCAASKRRRPRFANSQGQSEEDETMRLHQTNDRAPEFPGYFAAAGVPCPHCNECAIAPEASEFVESREIRHHWHCDACAHVFCTEVRLDRHEAAE